MSKNLIQIFARNLEPGKVKTRLIPELGKKGAFKLYKQILLKTIQNANLHNIETEIWITDNKFNRFKKIINIKITLQLFEQKGKNLGERMYFAIEHGLKRANKVILVGSDCPVIGQQHYVKLYDLLKTHDLALIPALDGGFVAIGARKIDPIIFKSINWGSDTVYEDTIKRIIDANLTYASLETLRDLDTYEDLIWHQQQKNIR